MLENFQLAAVIKQPHTPQIVRIPLHQALQTDLGVTWASQYEQLTHDKTLIPFTAGYTPEESDVFYLDDYTPPEWCRMLTSTTVHRLDALPNDNNTLEQIIGILGFGRWHNEELTLIQSFSRSHIIRPTRTLLFDNNVYQTSKNPGLHLSDRLTAAYTPDSSRLMFGNFRATNHILPLEEYYSEASEQQIQDMLSHPHFEVEDMQAYTKESSQWFRKRFAMLRDSKILDTYTVEQITAESSNYDVPITIRNGKIVFPRDKGQAKKILQYLNEEIFRGAITHNIYETNSKRTAD